MGTGCRRDALVNQRTAAPEKKTLKKESRWRFGTRLAMHKILSHVTGEQPRGVPTPKIEKNT
jgi:hypothetical protein